MKKNDLLLLISVLLYSYLFYMQGAGLNFLVFSAALVALLLIRDSSIYKNKSWLAAAAGTLLSGACVMLYANGLSVTANIISLCALSAFSVKPKTSLIVSLLFSLYSIVGSIAHMIVDAVNRSIAMPGDKVPKPNSGRWMLYVIPLLVVLLFFLLYKSSNPLFDHLTKKISFDFISFGWILFTITGFLLMYGFFHHKIIPSVSAADEAMPGTLAENFNSGKRLFNLSVDTEYKSAMLLLVALNALLLLVNLLDADFIFIDSTLPAGLTYSEFVHRGTGTLIFSILIAICIILFYFRGELNFYRNSRRLKMLAYAWVLQNAFMIFSTAYRNNLYIEVYSLTYRRIGVYVWLLLALIGLATTFVKICRLKSNWFLFRSNGWLFYAVLVIGCIVNWDVVIAGYNIRGAVEKHKALDKYYLLGLSDRTLPLLIRLDDLVMNKPVQDSSRAETGIQGGDTWFRELLRSSAAGFCKRMDLREWKSWSYYDAKVYREIIALEAEGKINLSDHHPPAAQESKTTEYIR